MSQRKRIKPITITDPKRLRRAIDRAHREAERYRDRGDFDAEYWLWNWADEAERQLDEATAAAREPST